MSRPFRFFNTKLFMFSHKFGSNFKFAVGVLCRNVVGPQQKGVTDLQPDKCFYGVGPLKRYLAITTGDIILPVYQNAIRCSTYSHTPAS
jgi:hypothetical protein